MKKPKSTLLAIALASIAGLSGVMGAQDVVAVAPDSHKLVLENDQVRVIRVHVKPGEKVAMHSHPPNGRIS